MHMPHVDAAGVCMKDAASFMVEELSAVPIDSVVRDNSAKSALCH